MVRGIGSHDMNNTSDRGIHLLGLPNLGRVLNLGEPALFDFLELGLHVTNGPFILLRHVQQSFLVLASLVFLLPTSPPVHGAK